MVYQKPDDRGSPLSVQLALDRLREEAIKDLFQSKGHGPETVGSDFGGKLWLVLTNEAAQQIEELGREGASQLDLIEAITDDLQKGCNLAIKRDHARGGLLLSIYSSGWQLLVAPRLPAWQVTEVWSNPAPRPPSMVGLPWRLLKKSDAHAPMSPLPAWLLMRATLPER